MQRYISLLCALFCFSVVCVKADTNTIVVPPLSIEKGATETILSISLDNENDITGFQFDLVLPEYISVATDDEGEYLIELLRTTPAQHSISTYKHADGVLRVLCSSMSNAVFAGDSGVVLNVTLKIAENIPSNAYSVNLKNIVLTDVDAKRYALSEVSSVLDLTPVVITTNDITMVYGDAVPELAYTSEGAELQGTPIISCMATSSSPVGTYPITISKGSVENYNVEYVSGTLTIVKAPLTISAGSYTKKQGEENPEFTATYSGFKNGESASVLTKQPTFTTDVVASTAPGQYTVKVSGAEAQNYEISYVDGTITVTEADKVTVTANNIIMVYGDAVPELTYASSDELIGVPQLSCSATSESPVGTYPITISEGSVENYNVEYVSGTLTIVKAPLTISAGSYTKKQGEENPGFAATYSGFKNGETASVLTKQPSFTTDVVASTAPGQYAVKVSGAEAQNYEISYVDGTMIVTDADKVTITANNITMVYGDAVPELTYASSDELIGVPQLSCLATSKSPVGTYPITVSKGSVENYNVEYVSGTLTIVKAPLIISAGSYTKKQGEKNPEFTAIYSGLKNGETSAALTKQPSFTTDVVASTAPGQYTVKVSGAEAQNYEISYVDGTITVADADKVTITANDITMVYGDAVPELTYASSDELIGVPQLSCSATSESPVGTYPITISKGSVENYNVEYVSGTLTIVKAPLTISAGSYTKKQGEENPEFAATYSGFKNGETSAVLTKQPTFTTDVTASTAPGQYTVKVSGAEAQNYEISYVDGTITVTDADKVTVAANNITMVYGDAVPELGYTCVDEFIGVPQLSCSATSESPVGTYPITISKGSVENYNVEYVSGTLTIVKAPLTISAGSYTKKQGEENPNFTATYSGFKNGETASVLTKQPAFTTDVTVSTAPGQYLVKVLDAEAQNYLISYVDGTITVTENSDYITFQDVRVERICIANWDINNDGLFSKEEAAAVTDLGDVFRNTYIKTFDELQFFLGLKIIPALTFNGCSDLESIRFPNSLTTIKYWAFSGCRSLKSLIIPASVTSVSSDGGWDDCVNIESIMVENGNPIYDSRGNCNAIIETATNKLVLGCKSTINVPNTIIKIGPNAFYNCKGLSTIVLPESLEEIGEDAFVGCTGLKSLYIPSKVRTITDGCFVGCLNLQTLEIDPNNRIYDSRDNCNAIIKTATNELVYGNSYTTIPSTVETIGHEAFGYCTDLISIDMPISIRSIKNAAFGGCSELTSIVIPDSCKYIEDFAFATCVKLSSISLPNGMLSIGESAFYKCLPLTSIEIPSSVNNIGNSAFMGCGNLTSVKVCWDSPLSVDGIFDSEILSAATLHVPKGTKTLYESAVVWKDFGTIVEDPAITADDITIEYGDDIPPLTFSSDVEVIGTPALSCSATPTSPVGTYPITISRGSVENENVGFVDGTLTIVKAPLAISAGSYTKKQGEENPEFTATYSGFKNGETANVLTKQPTFTTDVTASTAPGQYAVKVSGAEAQNYELSYVDGIITVAENNDYITFQDTEVERICLANWDEDKNGFLSKVEAAAITRLGMEFSQNKVITCFPELQYFMGLETIEVGAFANCSKLEKISFPTSLSVIDDIAFMDCEKLKEIFIPANVSVIGLGAFQGCHNLRTITVAVDNTVFDSRNNCNAVIKTESNELIFGNSYTVIPSTVVSIGNYAFGTSDLTLINIPSSVTSIGDDAFSYCASLTSITIPESVISIGNGAFYGCTSLTSITIPTSVTSIGNSTFGKCEGLTNVKVYRMQPLAISSGAFYNVDISTDTLYVPEGAKAFYEKASVWRDFGAIVEMPWIVPDDIDYIIFKDIEVERICLANWDTDGNGILLKEEAAAVTDLGEVFRDNDVIASFDELQYFTGIKNIPPGTFVNCHYLTSVQLPNTISIIGGTAFASCSRLSDINIPESVTRIERSAFNHCSQLKNITFPNSLTFLGSSAFLNCSKIEAINIPANVSVIESRCFMGCNDAQSVVVAEDNPFYDSRDNCNAIIETATNTLVFGSKNTTVIPNTITRIGEYAFTNAGKLLSIKIPKSVTRIERCGFGSCGVKEVVLPDGLTYLGMESFQYSRNLEYIYIPASVTIIESNCFKSCSGLKVFRVNWKAPLSVSESQNIFSNVDLSVITLHVPKGTKALYESAEVWKDFGTIVEDPAITVNDITIEYGDDIPPLTFSSDVEVIGTPALSCSATPTSPVGTYTITISRGSVENENVGFVDGTLTIVKAPLTISAGSYTKKQGEENPEFAATYSGFKNGETASVLTRQPTFITDVTASTASGQYAVKVSGAEAQNYEISYVDGSIIVTENIEGDYIYFADAEVERICLANWDANGDGLFSKDEAAAVTDLGEAFKGNSLIKNFDELEYFIGLESIAYRAFEKCSNLETLRFSDSVKEIGQMVFLGCAKLTSAKIPPSVTSIKQGVFVGCTGLTSVDIPPSVTSIEMSAFAGCTGLASIELPASVVSLEDYAFDRCSGLANLKVNWKTPLVVPRENYIFESVDVSSITLYVPAGTKALYEVAELWKDFGTISEVPSIVADDIIVEYGDEIPALTFNSNVDFVGSPELSCTATASSPVGTYPISISKGSVEDENVGFVDGTLTIVKAPLTISAGSYTKKQGEENPEFTATYSGFKNGETSAVLTKQPTFTTDVVASTVPSQYAVNVSGAEAQNYEISYVDGTITVTEADKVTITANDITMVYGDAVPELTFTSEGAELLGTPIVSCDVTSSSPVGTYPITISKGSVENYNVEYINGMLTIVKAPLRVVADDCTRAYGEENPVFTVSYEGWVNDEDEEVLTKSATVSCIADETTDVGVYDIVVSGAEAMNYSLTYTNGRLTIEKAMQEIVWEQDLVSAIIGDQVELTATATSGLEITYQLANTDIAEIYEANGKSYLDCLNVGQVVIKAIQNGDKNYHAAMRVNKTLVVSNPDGIKDVVDENADAPIYNMLGEQMGCSREELQRGVYIQNGRKFVVM